MHSDSVPLEVDLSNFKSSTNFGHTNLMLRIAEEMDRYFPNDSLAKKIVSSLNPLAFKQFENSYDQRKFNKKQKTYLRKILRGLLPYEYEHIAVQMEQYGPWVLMSIILFSMMTGVSLFWIFIGPFVKFFSSLFTLGIM